MVMPVDKKFIVEENKLIAQKTIFDALKNACHRKSAVQHDAMPIVFATTEMFEQASLDLSTLEIKANQFMQDLQKEKRVVLLSQNLIKPLGYENVTIESEIHYDPNIFAKKCPKVSIQINKTHLILIEEEASDDETLKFHRLLENVKHDFNTILASNKYDDEGFLNLNIIEPRTTGVTEILLYLRSIYPEEFQSFNINVDILAGTIKISKRSKPQRSLRYGRVAILLGIITLVYEVFKTYN